MPAFRLATDDDLRVIDSRNIDKIADLPFLYIPTDDPEVMRCWGVARSDGEASVAWYERKYPGCLVAPKRCGQEVTRSDLIFYHGAEPAADFLPE